MPTNTTNRNISNSLLASALPTYRTDIDGLRAIAVLSVVGYHAFPDFVSGGFVGVDIFFVISGFLISSIIFEGLSNGTFNFREFYFRRIRRIFPSLTVVLLACIILGWFALLPEEYKQLSKHIAGGASFISNLLLWEEVGYFDQVAETKPLLHLWSLGIEEQFYLLWPFLIYLAWRRINKLVLVIAIFIGSFSLSVTIVNTDAIAAFYSPVARFWELLSGTLSALFMNHHLRTNQGSPISGILSASTTTAIKEILALAGFWLLLGTIVVLDNAYTFPGWLVALPILGTVLLILTGPETLISRKILGNKIAVWFGLISYPLYLWHWPLLTFTKIAQSGTVTAGITMTVISISVVLAAITYRLIERPIRFGANTNRKTILLCAAMFIVGLIGFYTYLHDGFEKRPAFEEYRQNRTALKEDVSTHNKENCTTSPFFPYQQLNKDFFCMKSHEGSQLARNIIVGDSHAYPMYFGFYNLYVKQRGQDLQMLGAPGCPPFFDLESFEKGSTDICRGLMNSILNRITIDDNVKTVILVSRGPLYTSGVGYGSTDKHRRIIRRTDAIRPSSNSSIYQSALLETIQALQAHDKKIILVMPPPELGFEPISCTKARPIALTQKNLKDCGIDYNEYLERTSEFRAIISSIIETRGSIFVVDPSKVLCDSAFCRAYANDHFLYSDNNHLSARGARDIIDGISIPD